MKIPKNAKHREKPADPVAPDGEAFYVTAIDGDRWAPLAGPYKAHGDALAKVAAAKAKAYDADPRAHWYAYGTAKAADDLKPAFGAL